MFLSKTCSIYGCFGSESLGSDSLQKSELFVKFMETFRNNHLLNLVFRRGKVRLLLQAAVEVDEGFRLSAHFKKDIPFTKETLKNTEFKQITNTNNPI